MSSSSTAAAVGVDDGTYFPVEGSVSSTIAVSLGGHSYVLAYLLQQGEYVYGPEIVYSRARESGAYLGQRDAERFLAHKDRLPKLPEGTKIFFLGYCHPDSYRSAFCMVMKADGWQGEFIHTKRIWLGTDLFPRKME